MKSPRPPRHLSAPARAFWADVASNYGLEAHHAVLLTAAAEELDRITAAREEIERSGAFTRDRYGQTRANPAIGVESRAKATLSALLRQLGLDAELPGHVGRPPGRG